MKDSHRTTQAFMNLKKIVKDKISVFVNQTQLYPYFKMGAAGCWSTEVWMGPWPVVYLMEMLKRGEEQKAIEVIDDLIGDGSGAKPVPGAGSRKSRHHGKNSAEFICGYHRKPPCQTVILNGQSLNNLDVMLLIYRATPK
jgi:hypothetical protein